MICFFKIFICAIKIKNKILALQKIKIIFIGYSFNFIHSFEKRLDIFLNDERNKHTFELLVVVFLGINQIVYISIIIVIKIIITLIF